MGCFGAVGIKHIACIIFKRRCLLARLTRVFVSYVCGLMALVQLPIVLCVPSVSYVILASYANIRQTHERREPVSSAIAKSSLVENYQTLPFVMNQRYLSTSDTRPASLPSKVTAYGEKRLVADTMTGVSKHVVPPGSWFPLDFIDRILHQYPSCCAGKVGRGRATLQ